MQTRTFLSLLIGVVTLLAAPLALAHDGIHLSQGLADGFMHPATGPDHLLVAIAAGYWAARTGDHGLRGALLFLGLLVCGMLLGTICLTWPQLELALPLTFVLMMTVVAVSIALPHLLMHAMLGGLAMYQGLSHLLEMSGTDGLAGFGLGLFLSTAVLLKFGVILRHVIATRRPHAS